MATRYTKTKNTKRRTTTPKVPHKVRKQADGHETHKMKLLVHAYNRNHGVVKMPSDTDAYAAVLIMCTQMASDGLVIYRKMRKQWEITALGVSKVMDFHKVGAQLRGKTGVAKPAFLNTRAHKDVKDVKGVVIGRTEHFPMPSSAAKDVPGARTVNDDVIASLQQDVRLLSYALMWLRNHYATGIVAGDDREKVVLRADAVLAEFPPSMVTGEVFRERYPASKPKASASAARRAATEKGK